MSPKKPRHGKTVSRKPGKEPLRPAAPKQYDNEKLEYTKKKGPTRKGAKTMPATQKPEPTAPYSPRVAQWDRPTPLDEPEPAARRGEYAVQHQGETRGRRSRLFPDLNISATAAKLGVTKSHLAKVLSGDNRPSVDLAEKLAEALGVEITYVLALYRRDK